MSRTAFAAAAVIAVVAVASLALWMNQPNGQPAAGTTPSPSIGHPVRGRGIAEPFGVRLAAGRSDGAGNHPVRATRPDLEHDDAPCHEPGWDRRRDTRIR